MKTKYTIRQWKCLESEKYARVHKAHFGEVFFYEVRMVASV